MAYLKKYWHEYRMLFMLSVLCVSCEAICDLLQPKVMSDLIDNGAAKGDLDYVLHASVVMLGITVAGAGFAMCRHAMSAWVSQSFAADLRLDLFKKIQSLSIDETERFEGGSLVTRETSDITQLQNFINGMMRVFFKAPVMCVGAIIMTAMLDIKAIAVIIPITLLVGGVIFASMNLAYPRFAKVQEALDKLNTTMREYLAGIRLVKAFRRFSEEERRFSDSNGLLMESTIRANRILAFFSPCMSLFINLGIAAILFLGARWVGSGEMRVGQIMAIVTYMTQILTSLNMISVLLNMLVRVKSSNERIAEIMEIPESGAIRRPSAGCKAPEPRGKAFGTGEHIVFDNVGFHYRDSTGQAALTGISFSVGRGRTLGIIGSTGSGKSTVVSLLIRFYDAIAGEIRIDGVPFEEIPVKILRDRIAIVTQTPMLFSGTIRDNLLWGRASAYQEELEAAARAAQAHDFIMSSPMGYDTLIGQNGVNLSGGQKQRISIARALARAPEILVLDDCTSALDSVTEAKVKNALRSLPVTCIIITQRISTAMTCDRVLVLENGRQAGLGSHEELMKRCPEYRDIYLSQIGKEAE